MNRPRMLFLITEDWFARSHFLPLLARARAEGFEVVVACRDSGADLGDVRKVAFPFARSSLQPLDLMREALALRDLVRREEPDLIHAVALRPIVLVLVARIRRCGLVFALTGRGFLALHRRLWSRALAGVLRAWLRVVLNEGSNRVLLVENDADAAWVGGKRGLPDAQVVLMPGAGVDPDHFKPSPEPGGPITVGFASRLLHAKGIDVAVDAVELLRSRGRDIRLLVAGEPDPDHPHQFPTETMEHWHALDGVAMLGRVADVNGFWSGVHIACLPSRGGEGLPRSLLEAAACGRPIVTTSVPGCADFVRDGNTGFVVAPSDVGALSAAITVLAEDEGLRLRMGAAGRERVLAGFTEHHAAAAAARAWRAVLPR